MFEDIIAFKNENHTKAINSNIAFLIVKVGGAYTYRSAVRG